MIGKLKSAPAKIHNLINIIKRVVNGLRGGGGEGVVRLILYRFGEVILNLISSFINISQNNL